MLVHLQKNLSFLLFDMVLSVVGSCLTQTHPTWSSWFCRQKAPPDLITPIWVCGVFPCWCFVVISLTHLWHTKAVWQKKRPPQTSKQANEEKHLQHRRRGCVWQTKQIPWSAVSSPARVSSLRCLACRRHAADPGDMTGGPRSGRGCTSSS